MKYITMGNLMISASRLVVILVVCCGMTAALLPAVYAEENGGDVASGFDRTTIQVTPQAVIYNDDRGGRLLYPRQVFFDESMDEVYVVSSAGSGNSIYVLGQDYFPYYSLGKGRGVERPSCLYVDRQGNLYVGQDEFNNRSTRLSLFNAAFFKIKDIFFDEVPGAGKLVPNGIAVGPGGDIYVTSRVIPGVFVFDHQGNFDHRIVLLDRQDGKKITMGGNPESRNAVGFISIAIDKRGRVYLVSEEKGRIYVLDENEKFLFHFGVKGGAHGKLSRPRGIAMDEFRRVAYVVDYMRHTILMYDMDDGHFIHEFGGQGWSAGWFNYPTSVAVGNRGVVIVADYFNNRVQVLDVR